MRKKRATLVHINPMGGVTPLVGGYLKTFAEQEEEIRMCWEIELYNTTTDSPASKIIGDLVKRKPDVIGFSLYVWNIGIVLRILPSLRSVLPPSTQYLLGGVQIMNSAEDYVDRTWENVAVCNGEGERTFQQYLLQFLNGGLPRFEEIRGITFHRDGEFITTEAQPRIKDLEEIPSPFLADIFDPADLAVTLLETNRDCPYRCEYCFWGGAIGQKINRLPVDRIKQEIAYLASKRARSILLCDANFGYEDKMEDLGVITLDEADPVGGGKIVIQTKDATHEEWVSGMVFTNAVMWLYDLETINQRLRITSDLPPELLVANPTRMTIDHARGQIFRMPFKRDEDHHQFCHQFVTEIGNSLPICTVHHGEPALIT